MAAAGLPDPVTDLITSEEYGRLWTVMAAAAEDEFFGLAARPMRLGSFTLMCHAVLHAPNLERALRRALRFLNVMLEDPRAELRVESGEAQIILIDAGQPRVAFAYRTYWLILMGLACWLIGRQIPLRQVDIACPAPENRVDYRQFFGAPVRFDARVHRLTFDVNFLTLPVNRSEQALKVFLRGAPANILVRYRHDVGFAATVRDWLRGCPPPLWPSFDALANTLELSPATLRRHLRREGQSFAAIKDELRCQRAQELLAGDLSVADIAGELGYSEPSAFHRAFLKWTDRQPGAFRLALRAGWEGPV